MTDKALLCGWFWGRTFLAALVFVSFFYWNETSFADQKKDLMDYSIDELVDLYVELTLSVESFEGFESLGYLRKWTSGSTPTIVTHIGDSLFDQTGRVDEVLEAVHEISDDVSSRLGKPVLRALGRQELLDLLTGDRSEFQRVVDEGIVIFVGAREEIQEIADQIPFDTGILNSVLEQVFKSADLGSGVPCMGVGLGIGATPDGVNQAKILIEDGPWLEECVYEELMQVFGMPNDFPAGTASLFNDDNVFNRPTELDWLLWRLHFDERLKTGMREYEVRLVAAEVLANFFHN